MSVEPKNDSTGRQTGTIAIFVPANGQANGADIDQKLAVQQFHARLSSPEFAEQMTGIFFDAKRAALAGLK